MDLLIVWKETDAKGYVDVIPGALIQSSTYLKGGTHLVRGPKGGEYTARYDFRPDGRVVEIDYRPYKENEAQLEMGILRLSFSGIGRTGEPEKIEWKSVGDKSYSLADAIAVRDKYPSAASGLVPIHTSTGDPVHAHFSVRHLGDAYSVILESRGGAIGGPNERNRGYSIGLRLLLRRLAVANAALKSAALAAQSSPIPIGDRQLVPTEFTFPLQLTPSTDEDRLASQIQRLLGTIGTKSSSGTGNTTRRLELVVAMPDGPSRKVLEAALAGLGMSSPLSEAEVESASNSIDFDPADDTDARKKTLASIARRQGQPKFRKDLKAAYGGQCAITGSPVVEVLEAAHIRGFKGEHTNHIQNGLLLRTDIHTLFDLGLIGVDASTWTTVVHHKLKSGEYGLLHGKPVSLPAKAGQRPNGQALQQHLDRFGLK